MAWSWSHTDEAYWNVRENIARLPLTTLHVIYAEWRASGHGSKRYESWCPQFNARKYWDALRYAAEHLDSCALAEQIYAWAEEGSTCDNGGWDAWVCPHGCHTVPFSPIEEDGEVHDDGGYAEHGRGVPEVVKG